MTNLVLASASVSRARMLTAVGVPFTIDPADIDEGGAKATGAPPAVVAENLAGQKAVAVSMRHPEAWVLGADQVMVFEGGLVSKCRDLDEARALLMRLSGHTHELLSAAALAQTGTVVWRALGRAKLRVRTLSEAYIDQYLAREGKALLSGVGCYRMEERGAQLFDTVKGDYFSILGLPLLPVLAALRERGMLQT